MTMTKLRASLQTADSDSPTTPRVAYFCMEYGLHPEFHLYAGGLGILAGDYLKAAHDLNLPVVGIGLLWRQGYTRQVLNEQGVPYDTYPIYDYEFLKDTGVKVKVDIRGRVVTCKVWLVDKYGNAPLYLLDTNLPENSDRWITGQLYGWFGEERVAQEIVLGIGGVRALRALNIPVDVYHFNEGHAALAALELIKEKMNDNGSGFEQALDATRNEIVFTTHTPVKEGNESHPLNLLEYMGAFNGLSREQMIALGGDPFNMTVAGLRLSRLANGVSALHGQTARQMWKDVAGAAPIIAITNGVHAGTWQDARMRKAYETGTDLWQPHLEAKKELLSAVQARTGAQLNQDSLLIGFARRAVPYKRSDLIFSDPQVIEPYLRDGRIQLIFSGKAHPLDDQGKAIVARLVSFSKTYPNSVVFLENYDMEIGRLLTRGTDIWLNNPKRPLEASGTSGMKAAMNGILNVSVLDGWWPEGCIHDVNGWEFGHGYEGPQADEIDLAGLYQVMLGQVVPTFYQNRQKWTRMMRAAIDMSVEQFSANRMMHEYFERMYAAGRQAQERQA